MILLTTLLTACATGPDRNAVPEDQEQAAGIPGIERARAWGDEPPVWLDRSLFLLSDGDVRARFPGVCGRPHQYVAISGGGSDGAFGAGLLNGWSAAGNRLQFKLVTGISTGALIAPFAFLGPEHDAVLRETYTRYSPRICCARATGSRSLAVSPSPIPHRYGPRSPSTSRPR